MSISNIERRLDRIEQSLDPQQAVHFIMEKAFLLRSTEDHEGWRHEKFDELIRHIFTGVANRTRNESRGMQALTLNETANEISRLLGLWISCDRFASTIIREGFTGLRHLIDERKRLLELINLVSDESAPIPCSIRLTPRLSVRLPNTTLRTGTVLQRARYLSGSRATSWRENLRNLVTTSTLPE